MKAMSGAASAGEFLRSITQESPIGLTLAVAVVRIPRLIGASVGVKETVTLSPAALESPCSTTPSSAAE